MSMFLEVLADVLRTAGLTVVELDGWQRRGRSGNVPYADGRPWCVMWHHTASAGDGAADADYCTFGSPDAPLANLVIGRDGVVYVCAAGPTNTNGKGGPLTFSRGTVPVDSMNSYAVGIEFSNNGVGQTWPTVQIDAGMTASTAIAAAYGLEPEDAAIHFDWAPTRKIDTAVAGAVQGPWHPAAVNPSGTWSTFDLRAELRRRAGTTPPPPDPPPPSGDLDMIRLDYGVPGTDSWWTRMLLSGNTITWVQGHANDGLDAAVPGHIQVKNDQHMTDLLSTFQAMGPVPSTWSTNPGLSAAWHASAAR